jgi:hypothetical protein
LAYDNPEYQLNEALTNLYVCLHRDLRHGRLSAMRFIQVHAVDRVLTFLQLTESDVGEQQDVFVVERGAERRFGPMCSRSRGSPPATPTTVNRPSRCSSGWRRAPR